MICAYNWDKVFYVKTSDIKFFCGEVYDINMPNEILDGNWDCNNLTLIEDVDVYKSCYEMFAENKKWEDTFLYKEGIDRIGRGICQWSCWTKEEFLERGNQIAKLFNSISEKGIGEQKKLVMVWNPTDKFDDEMICYVDRNGGLLFANGFHRLAIAKILNIKIVPVKIKRRHKEWDNFCESIFSYCVKNWGGFLYQPINHFEFEDVPSLWSNNRFELVKYNLDNKEGTVLDIGALWGNMAGNFESIGFDCFAVENYSEYFPFIEKLKRVCNYKFKIIKDSVFNIEKVNYDVVVAFNIFHHFLKTSDSFLKFSMFLNRLRCKEMFVQFHDYNDPQMNGAYVNFPAKNFAEFIMTLTRHSNYKKIGEEKNREIYKIW